LVPLVHMAVAK